jgi:hypothetical protein
LKKTENFNKDATSTRNADADFYWPDVVIGADIDAVEFAYKNNFHLLKNRVPYHHSYEGIEEPWASMCYDLYARGMCPFVDKISKIRVDQNDKTIKVITGHNTFEICYDNLHVFDSENVGGVENNKELVHYRVVDWFDCKGLYDLSCKQIISDDDFVNKVMFFKSRRIDGNQRYLDLLCESFLTDSQLKSFEYSDTMVRFKVRDMLKKHLNKEIAMSLWKRDIYPVYKCLQKNT